jgi:ABC-type branched-subunit amino acid transport system substrate-binding protein
VRLGFLSAALAAMLAAIHAAPAAAAKSYVPAGVRAADSLAATPVARERDEALGRWAPHGSLRELLYVLRRPAAELGTAEPILLEAALHLVPDSRAALRQRLTVRLAAADPKRGESAWRKLAPDAARLPRHPGASVFRVAAVLPDAGDYQGFAADVALGIRAGIAQYNAGAALPLELMMVSSGDDTPARVAGAFAQAAEGSAVLIGGLVSEPTVTLATAAQLTGVPLLSPTAGDEAIGTIGPGIFQVGPSGLQRGRALARAVVTGTKKRIGILLPGPFEDSPFARGFAAEAESLGSTVAWSGAYAPGSPDLKNEVRQLQAQSVDLVFWDGEARDGATLLRQMTQDRMSVAICGGAEFSPDRQHPQVRPLLEGVVLVAEDWTLAPASQAVLDSLVRAQGGDHANRLHVRGYLAARLIASAIEGGALCPEELTQSLVQRVGKDPQLKSRGFLDWTSAEATLPVQQVSRGRLIDR